MAWKLGDPKGSAFSHFLLSGSCLCLWPLALSCYNSKSPDPEPQASHILHAREEASPDQGRGTFEALSWKKLHLLTPPAILPGCTCYWSAGQELKDNLAVVPFPVSQEQWSSVLL